MQEDARRLRIDYIKPSIVDRGGRPRSAGGGCSESRGPVPAGAGSCSGRGAAAAAGDASGGGGLESGGPAPASRPDELILHSYSHMQNQIMMVLELEVVAGKHDVANGREFHSKKFAVRIKDFAALVSFS